MSDFAKNNAATIALVVAIVALFASLLPQITEFVNGSSAPVHKTQQGRGGGMPGPGGPGGGMRGPGGMGGMGGMRRETSPELKALCAKRLELFDEAIKAASPEDAAKLKCEKDQFRIQNARQNRGGFRISTGATEAFVIFKNSQKCPKATPLCKNKAEMDYQRALDTMRGDKEAFLAIAQKLADYPTTPLTDEDIENLLNAETPQMGPGR